MGKAFEEEQPLPISDGASLQNADSRSVRCLCRLIGFRCLFVLLLSAAVFISAVFWLPPFLQPDDGDLDLDLRLRGHDILASFNVRKSISFLEDNIVQLEDDIFYELSSPANTKVVILYLEPLETTNTTKVVFGVDSSAKYTKLSPTARSLIRSNFELLVVNQSLRLTPSLFGDPFSFEVLKFPRGITIIPQQSAFLLQKVQIRFNFTLNFSIYQIQMNFAELTAQLRSGLHLASYENLYISLSNSKGSTVAPPTIVQSTVVLAVGTPSIGRSRQLAQTITGQSRNLGLNNTVFGKVKQVRLSSIPQHPSGELSPSPSPSPAPLPHHHRHHHRHRHHSSYPAPAASPEPGYRDISPAPLAKPPGCHYRSPGNTRKHSHLAPMAAPSMAPHYLGPSFSPGPHIGLPPVVSPAPPPIPEAIPASSPLPGVIFARVPPPSVEKPRHSDVAPSVSPLPSSAPSLCFSTTLFCVFWVALSLLVSH